MFRDSMIPLLGSAFGNPAGLPPRRSPPGTVLPEGFVGQHGRTQKLFADSQSILLGTGKREGEMQGLNSPGAAPARGSSKQRGVGILGKLSPVPRLFP